MYINNDDPNSDVSSEVLIPDLPSFIPVEVQPKSEEEIERENAELQKKLLVYGITDEEWEAVSRYKGTNYFSQSTMLHNINLFDYNYPRFGNPLDYDFLNPKSIIDFYCKIYSAMCKFGKQNNKQLNVYRFDSDMFSEEMRQTGQTGSVMSFSKDSYNYDFSLGKKDVVLLKGILRKGIPCIDFSELMDDKEHEVLLPPFLNISLNNTGKIIDDEFPLFNVDISKDNPTSLTDEEKEEMESLKNSIIDSNIPHDYYSNWYAVMRQNPQAKGDDEESIKLREDFLKWQEKLKKYLKLRFREIENALDYHTIDPSEFLGVINGRNGMELITSIFGGIRDLFSNWAGKDK